MLSSDGTYQVSGKSYAELAGRKMSLYYDPLTSDGKVVGHIPTVAGENAQWKIDAGNKTWISFTLGDGGSTYNNCIFEHIAAVQPYYKGE